MAVRRKIIRIDEEKCTGCGDCIPNCPEGALQVIDGKARLVSDLFCDGLGACIGHCPVGAITVEEREAEPYDERKVIERIVAQGPEHDIPEPEPASSGCPGARAMCLEPAEATEGEPSGRAVSRLRHWPVQIALVAPIAPFLDGADVVVVADCVPFAYANLHEDFLKGRAVLVGCPKLDDAEAHIKKLAAILEHNDIRSIEVRFSAAARTCRFRPPRSASGAKWSKPRPLAPSPTPRRASPDGQDNLPRSGHPLLGQGRYLRRDLLPLRLLRRVLQGRRHQALSPLRPETREPQAHPRLRPVVSVCREMPRLRPQDHTTEGREGEFAGRQAHRGHKGSLRRRPAAHHPRPARLRGVVAAALLHDIGIKEAERKHGSAAPKFQELEGPPIARRILEGLDLPEKDIQHVCQIVANHHSARDIDTPEFRMVWDADWLVNFPGERGDAPPEELPGLIEKTFRTPTGKRIALERFAQRKEGQDVGGPSRPA